jgi:hypothetical protein
MKICESHINATKGYRFGDDYVYDVSDMYMGEDATVGELFRSFQKEFGRCTSKVYVDTPDGAKPVGWVFVKREKYEDVNEHYIHETWVTLLDVDETIHRRVHHYID